jgi:hypothetical protein
MVLYASKDIRKGDEIRILEDEDIAVSFHHVSVTQASQNTLARFNLIASASHIEYSKTSHPCACSCAEPSKISARV